MTSAADMRMSPLRRDFHARVARVHSSITPLFAPLTAYRPGMQHWRKHELKNAWGKYRAGRVAIILSHDLIIPLVKIASALSLFQAYWLQQKTGIEPKFYILAYISATALKAGMITHHENTAANLEYGTPLESAGLRKNAHRYAYNFTKHLFRPF